jgi:hypothetical protein
MGAAIGGTLAGSMGASGSESVVVTTNVGQYIGLITNIK